MNLLVQQSNTHSVSAALSLLRQELIKPRGVFDPFVALAALENLVDVSRENNDSNAHRYNIIFKQTRCLQNHPRLQPLLVKLVGDKDEIDVAKFIEKSLRASATAPSASGNSFNPARYTHPVFPTFRYPTAGRPRPYSRPAPRCFNCRRTGHFVRYCPVPRR